MESKTVEIEYSPEYIKKMQTEAMFDALGGRPPEYLDNDVYMDAYLKSLKK